MFPKSSHLLLAGFLGLATALHAQTTPPLGSARSKWPGVRFEIAKIVRTDPDHILVAVIVRGDASVKNPTLIGTPEPAGGDPNHVKPFSLLSAKLIDQATGAAYPADGKLPAKPYWGDPDIVSNIRPNTWFQLAVRFKAPPPPPPDAQGKKPPQLVTFLLPQATKPIKDVKLP